MMKKLYQAIIISSHKFSISTRLGNKIRGQHFDHNYLVLIARPCIQDDITVISRDLSMKHGVVKAVGTFFLRFNSRIN